MPTLNKRGVVIMLLIATTNNFLDRQTLSVLAPELQKELGISTVGYSAVVNSFLGVYAVMYLLAGRMVDWLGTRRGLGIAIIWWSLAQIGHAYVTGLASLCVVRALLAFGEAAVIPSAVKAVAEWFEAKERGVAISVFEAGLSLGPMLAPPLVVAISLHFGWRSAFLVTGMAGFLIAAIWLLCYRRPAVPPEADPAVAATPTGSSPWAVLFRSRAIWAVGITRIFGDPVWFFYLFWLPKYLSEAKNLSLTSIGAFAWIPYAAQILGNFAGGGAASWLIRRGMPPVQARFRVMLFSSAIVSCGVLSVLTNNIALVLLAISAGAFALSVWGINVETLPTDIFPPDRVAAGVGLGGLLGTLGGVVFTAVTGYVVQNYSYTPIWIASAVMYPVGWALAWLLMRSATAEEKNAQVTMV